MDQSNKIFGAILLAFLVYITMRGELPTYLTFLRGGGDQPKPQQGVAVAAGGAKSGGGLFDSILAPIGEALGQFEKPLSAISGGINSITNFTRPLMRIAP